MIRYLKRVISLRGGFKPAAEPRPCLFERICASAAAGGIAFFLRVHGVPTKKQAAAAGASFTRAAGRAGKHVWSGVGVIGVEAGVKIKAQSRPVCE